MNTASRSPAPAGEVQRRRIEVRGLVQGVGFRPQVLRLATRLGYGGWVRNHSAGVTIEVEGVDPDRFAAALRADLPPMARVDSLRSAPVAITGECGFHIAASEDTGAVSAIPADVAICDACLGELFDPADRRYLHPFIACCNCGPRYSMTRRLPYDRQSTAMADFPLCPSCSSEYRHPEKRRLHAEPIACHDCGPTLSHRVVDIVAALGRGEIVALKGIGGYHLLCDARSEESIAKLRARKQRLHKPLAVLALNAVSIAREVELNAEQARLLGSPQRPIVILPRKGDSNLPEALSPGIPTLGVMLPYTPLHYLLFHGLLGKPDGQAWLQAAQTPLLVCTSANRSGEPMVREAREAERYLAGVADLIVHHNREITYGCDDSVFTHCAERPVLLRRGRGFAPQGLRLPRAVPPVLALGAHLKNTACALHGTQGYFSSHVGDLDTPQCHALLAQSAQDLLTQLKLSPQAIACDLHPDFASTRIAEGMADELSLPLVRVQHHHAHIAACAAASGHTGPVLGLALDGHGLGTDGGSWGGELLRVDGPDCDRLGHLREIALPGGDRAAREPWRIAAAWLARNTMGSLARQRFADQALLEPVMALAQTENCPRSSAAGRYFDLAAALLGLSTESAFEAQAAMVLEGRCEAPRAERSLYRLVDGELDLDPLLAQLVTVSTAEEGAALFHGTLIAALADWVQAMAERTGLDTVALGGGCFANRWLAEQLPRALEKTGLRVLTAWDLLPPGDGGISLGQAWVAALALERGDAKRR